MKVVRSISCLIIFSLKLFRGLIIAHFRHPLVWSDGVKAFRAFGHCPEEKTRVAKQAKQA